MAVAAFGRTIVALRDGRVLAAGGVVSDGDPEAPYLGDAEIYDPALDRWTTTTPMPMPRLGGAAVLLPDGSVLIAGGAGHPGLLAAPGCPVPESRSVRFVPPTP
jgi:hypothetical protein